MKISKYKVEKIKTILVTIFASTKSLNSQRVVL